MAATSLRCPECDTRVRIPDGKTSARCPECGERVRLDEPDEDEEDEPRPAKSRRRDDDEDDRPRKRRRDDAEDEDDRPRKRGKRKAEPAGEGPWALAAAAAAGCFVVTLGLAFLINGRAGLAPGQDGPGGKLAGLGIGFVVSLILVPIGVMGVKARHAYGKWGTEVTGGMAVTLGMIQAVMGGIIAGFTLYGLIFTIINGR